MGNGEGMVRNPDDAGKESGREIVTVFVRKGKEEDTRLLSFRRPVSAEVLGIQDNDFLNAGFAFDGNSLSVLVTPYTRVGYFMYEKQLERRYLLEDAQERPFLQVLHEVQVMIRDWLEGAGMLVYFS